MFAILLLLLLLLLIGRRLSILAAISVSRICLHSVSISQLILASFITTAISDYRLQDG